MVEPDRQQTIRRCALQINTVCNTFCFPTATMVMRTRLISMLVCTLPFLFISLMIANYNGGNDVPGGPLA
jgi:hypothetical protein